MASVTNDTLVLLHVWESVTAVSTHLWTRRIGSVQVGRPCPFASGAAGAARIVPQPLLRREDHDPSTVHIFPVNAFLFTLKSKHSSASTSSRKTRKRAIVSALPVSTEFINKDGGGSLSKQYCAIWASNPFISNCHKCGAPLPLG